MNYRQKDKKSSIGRYLFIGLQVGIKNLLYAAV